MSLRGPCFAGGTGPENVTALPFSPALLVGRRGCRCCRSGRRRRRNRHYCYCGAIINEADTRTTTTSTPGPFAISPLIGRIGTTRSRWACSHG